MVSSRVTMWQVGSWWHCSVQEESTIGSHRDAAFFCDWSVQQSKANTVCHWIFSGFVMYKVNRHQTFVSANDAFEVLNTNYTMIDRLEQSIMGHTQRTPGVTAPSSETIKLQQITCTTQTRTNRQTARIKSFSLPTETATQLLCAAYLLLHHPCSPQSCLSATRTPDHLPTALAIQHESDPPVHDTAPTHSPSSHHTDYTPPLADLVLVHVDRARLLDDCPNH